MDLTKGSIPSLIKTIAIPASIGFFFNTMYNVVDTYFAGQVSVLGQAALSVSFPVFFIIISISSGLSSGTTALMGNALGEGKKEEAAHYGIQALTLGLFVSIFITILGFIISPTLFKFLGAEGEYLDLALSYMNTLYWGTVFFVITFICNGILNAVGDTKSFRNFLIVGFFINIILNPMLLFGWGPLPALGMAGIAIATILVEIFGAIYMFYKVSELDIMHIGIRKHIKPQWKYYKEIFIQGFPSSLNMMSVSVGIFVIMYFLSQFGPETIAAFGIGMRIEQIALLPMIGMNIAVLSILSQNRGAKLTDRILETVKTSIKYSAVISFISAILLIFLSPLVMKFFTSDPEVIKIGVGYLRIEAFALFAYVMLFLADSVYRAYKKPVVPLVLSIIRQIILPLPIFYLMTFVFETNIYGLWFSLFGIVWIAAIVFSSMAYRLIKTDLK